MTKRKKRTTKTGSDAGPAARRVFRCSIAAVGMATAAFLMIASACVAQSASASPEVEEARALVASVIDRYESSRSYEIEFTQENFWALADTTHAIEGVLLLERPDRLSVTYDDGGRIVVDGDSLRVFVPATNQFFTSSIDSSDVMLDPARLLRQFTPDTERPFEPLDGAGGLRALNLRPLKSFVEPAHVQVTIDTARRVVVRLVARTTTGDRTTYRMRATRYDVPTPDSEFELKLPAGAERMTGSPFAGS
jgi:outer membrane lipoprotein-sorting protein